ncbi:MAG: HD domain-containing protein [Methanothrix sp.]|nr:MAG: HD domain-containing protein [Methanothrix sp.]
MNSCFLSFYQTWFDDYASRFHSPDPEIEKNIILKLKHTARVRDNISRIAGSLLLSPEEVAMAEVLAILHDVGRFEQLRQYGTFNDRISTDHAALGVKVIVRSGILHGLPKDEGHLLQRAVWLHNKYAIPETERGERLLFSRLIRDADKLDILGLIVGHLEMRNSDPNMNKALDLGLEEETGFSRQAVHDILNRRLVGIAALKNLNDMRLMYLSWVFDINFPVTFSIIEERGYLESLQTGLPQDREICEAVDFINAYLQERKRTLI